MSRGRVRRAGGWSRACASFLLLAAAACATAQQTRQDPPDPEAELLSDLGEFDLTELALLVSGFESRALREARVRFEGFIGPVVERAALAEGEEGKAKALLAELHVRGGLLGQYDARATTLRDILDRRAFNCLSASILYNVLAERLGLHVEAQLLPTHARTLLVRSQGEPVVIETTSPLGYDPDRDAQVAILAQVAAPLMRGERALVPQGGARVSNMMLIGAMFVNRASIAQEAGDLAQAERLFGRGEAFAIGEDMRTLLRDQRAALLSQLGADDIISNDLGRLPRAYQTLKAAAALDPKDQQIRANVLQNLRAAGERVIAQGADMADEELVLRVLNEVTRLGVSTHDRSGLRAFAMSEVSRLRASRGDLDGAVTAIELALNEELAPRDAPLKDTLEQNRIAALRLAAMTSAKRGEYDKSIKLIEKLQSIPGLTGDQRREYAADRLRAIQWVAQKRLEDGDANGAIAVYREGLKHFPADPTLEQSLAGALQRYALPMIEKGACADALDTLEEIRTLDPGSKFAAKATVRCLTVRANELLKNRSYTEAVALLKLAQQESPSDPLVLRNLAIAVLHTVQHFVRSGECKKAIELARGVEGDTVKELEQALAPCRSP